MHILQILDKGILKRKDILINESEAIDNCQKSVGLLSDETIISMHPWIDDPQLELERLKKQKEENQKEMEQQYFGSEHSQEEKVSDDVTNNAASKRGGEE